MSSANSYKDSSYTITLDNESTPYIIDSNNWEVDITQSYSPGLEVSGDANFKGDVKIKGKSLIESIERIEQQLAILTPNPELEESWEELKMLGDRYRALEKKILEQNKLVDILKGN